MPYKHLESTSKKVFGQGVSKICTVIHLRKVFGQSVSKICTVMRFLKTDSKSCCTVGCKERGNYGRTDSPCNRRW